MKGLLIKELYTMRGMGRIMAGIAVFFMLMGLVGRNVDRFVGMIAGACMIFSILPAITSFSQDVASGWDRYALSMPLSRKQVVGSKYLLCIGGALTGSVIDLAAVLLSWPFLSGETRQEVLLVAVVLFLTALLLQSLLLPLIYRFGLEKARFLLMAICLLPSLLLLLFEDAAPLEQLSLPDLSRWMPMLLLAGAVLTAGLMTLSYFLSLRIFTRRDL